MPIEHCILLTKNTFIVGYICTNIYIYIYIYIYIMKIIPTWPRASLPRFHQSALLDCTGAIQISLLAKSR